VSGQIPSTNGNQLVGSARRSGRQTRIGMPGAAPKALRVYDGLALLSPARKELLALGPSEMADRVTAFWREAETRHAGQRELVTALIDRLTGRSTVMYEVASRERLPRIGGREGAMFCIYWGR
jgi:hypothetical protein